MKTVLILCTGNSCRSQMAEALWNRLGKGRWRAYSAGSRPVGFVHPLAIRAMAEIGLDMSGNRSKHLDEFRNRRFDLVVTVCDRARESCTVFFGAGQTLHWPFPDPAEATGDDAQRLTAFRSVRDQIQERITAYLRHELHTPNRS
ncbi:MAG TPA: arsenate reductase ArsC [Planctomycetaceae bacterium]|nr:arsenate reductase ArsC [Planctomycetaceae bacterium]HIQ22844.1 arsenate reductase ArsC [Planctomycetota bacterium]